MAEGIMNDVILDHAKDTAMSPNLKVVSAGTYASAGCPASEHAVVVAAEEGIDIGNHRSNPLTIDMVAAADLILTMEHSHAVTIRNIWLEAPQTVELKCFGRDNSECYGNTEIMDPIGMGVEVYRSVFREIHQEIERISPLIFTLAEKKSGDRTG